MSSNNTEIYVAIDIEAFGPALDAPVVAVGYCVGDRKTILENDLFCFPADRKEMEAKCKEQFWDKNPDLLPRIEVNATLPVQDQWLAFQKWLDGLEDRYPNREIIFISDNPRFDLGKIDYQLKKYCGRIPCVYLPKSGYCSTEDPWERLCAIPKKKKAEIIASTGQKVQHTHWPVDDARYIYTLHMELLDYISQLEDI